MNKKVLIWLSGEDIRLFPKAIQGLIRDVDPVTIVGMTGTRPISLVIDGQRLPFIKKEQLREIGIDYVLLTGGRWNIRSVEYELEFYGLKDVMVLPDRVVCLVGFSVARYHELKKSELSIFSLNCFGGIISHLFCLPFRSPFVNLFSTEDSFIEFLEGNPARTFFNKLKFVESCYEENLQIDYPRFRCGNLDLWMNYYPDIPSAVSAWNKRKTRVNFDNLFVVMYTNNQKILERFDKLPYQKKICFTFLHSELESVCTINQENFGNRELWDCVNHIALAKYQPLDLFALLLYGKQVRV